MEVFGCMFGRSNGRIDELITYTYHLTRFVLLIELELMRVCSLYGPTVLTVCRTTKYIHRTASCRKASKQNKHPNTYTPAAGSYRDCAVCERSGMEEKSPSKKIKRDRTNCACVVPYHWFFFRIVGTNAIVQFLSFSKSFRCVRVAIIYSCVCIGSLIFFPLQMNDWCASEKANHMSEMKEHKKMMNTFLWLGFILFSTEFSSPNLINLDCNSNGFSDIYH